MSLQPERLVRSRAAVWLLSFIVLPVALVFTTAVVAACCLAGAAFELLIGAR